MTSSTQLSEQSQPSTKPNGHGVRMQTDSPVPPLLVKAEVIAARYELDVSWVLRKAGSRTPADKRMPSVLLGRYRRFRIADVDLWMERQK
jgi:hypothetical protein